MVGFSGGKDPARTGFQQGSTRLICAALPR